MFMKYLTYSELEKMLLDHEGSWYTENYLECEFDTVVKICFHYDEFDYEDFLLSLY